MLRKQLLFLHVLREWRQDWGHAVEVGCTGAGSGLRGSGRLRRYCRQQHSVAWLLQLAGQRVLALSALAGTVLHWEVAFVVPQLVLGPVLLLLAHRRTRPACWLAAEERVADT